MESLNHNPNRLKKIYIEIDKLLINSECIDFFMQIYMKWSKDNGSTSSFRTLIIPRLPRFEELDLLQLKVYIETETVTHCFVCCNSQKTIFIRYSEGKERLFFILHMLRIQTGLQKLSEKIYMTFILKKRFHLKSVNHASLLQGENCYLNNI